MSQHGRATTIDNAASSPRREGLPPSSLVICSRNRPDLLLETVESVLAGDELPDEIVVVDQSDEPHPSLAGRGTQGGCRICYLRPGTTGLSKARNHGAANASHPILVFVDDDVLVPSNWYGALIRAVAAAGPNAAVTGRVLAGPADAAGGFVPVLIEGTRARTYAGRIGTDVLAGCHFALHRSLFDAVGPFDERLGAGTRFGAEDNDYGYRLLEMGYRIVYAPEAAVRHRAWRGPEAYYRLRWSYGRGQGAFYAKNLEPRDPYIATRMIRDLGLRVVRFPWRFAHRPRLAIGDVFFTVGVLVAACEWLIRYGPDPRGSGADSAAVKVPGHRRRVASPLERIS